MPSKLIVRRVGQSTGCQINFPQSHAELLSKASEKLQLTTPATLCFTETGDLVLADDFETIESGDTTYVSCGEPWVPPEQATQGFAKRKHGLLSELAQDGKVSLHDADAAIQDRIKNEASPILNKACDATKHTVLLRLGDQGCKWGYGAMESAVSPAFDSLLETEPLFKDVLAGRMQVKLGMGCSSFYAGSKRLKMERGQVHPAPKFGGYSTQTYSVDKGYVQEGTRIIACGLGPISVDDDCAMSHAMNQHMEDVLIELARHKLNSEHFTAVANSDNAGGQGNKSKLKADDQKLQKGKVHEVVRYVYINFRRVG